MLRYRHNLSRRRLWATSAVIVLQAITACSIRSAQNSAGNKFHLGAHHFAITTKSPAAQTAFDRGLIYAFAFNHESAEREFRLAANIDPSAAMPWWGIALVNGPHINFPVVPPERARIAWEALTNARARLENAAPLEKQLIAAQTERYRENQPKDRSELDKAYATAMERLWKEHPENGDIGTLYAEAMMDLRPWDLWTAKGVPQPGTETVVRTLESVLQKHPDHPGANHLYIHAVEASLAPQKALPAADRLRTLVPGASHLVHMPSHIYARTGRWKAAEDSNVSAAEADDANKSKNPKPGFYALYMAHNRHFLAFAAMMRGRKHIALAAAREMVSEIPDEFLAKYGEMADGFTVFVPEVMMRFGMWNDLLQEPPPRGSLPFATAMWHFTRATALNALGREKELHSEQKLFRRARGVVPKSAAVGNNSSVTLLKIADHVLRGEIAARHKDYHSAIAELRKAIRIEDTLRYDEPPDWIQPVRHTLGAVLLAAGKYREAEACYREDLLRYPQNGWSLFGLSRALRLQGKTAEADETFIEYKAAWKDADVDIASTCFCQKES